MKLEEKLSDLNLVDSEESYMFFGQTGHYELRRDCTLGISSIREVFVPERSVILTMNSEIDKFDKILGVHHLIGG